MNKSKTVRGLRIAISLLMAAILAYGAVLDYSLWVLPPLGKTKVESIELLQSGIVDKAIDHLILGILVVAITVLLNWLIQSKIEKTLRQHEIVVIAVSCVIILGLGIVVGMNDAYKGLLIEIDRNFN